MAEDRIELTPNMWIASGKLVVSTITGDLLHTEVPDRITTPARALQWVASKKLETEREISVLASRLEHFNAFYVQLFKEVVKYEKEAQDGENI